MFEKFVDSTTHSQPGATPNGCGVFEEFAAGLMALDPAAMHRAERRDAAMGAKRARAALDAFEARLVSASSRLDGGGSAAIELMRATGGCSGREAHRRFRRAAALVRMPTVAGALAEGAITSEHADALARAAEDISAETVEADEGLLERVKSLPADLAARCEIPGAGPIPRSELERLACEAEIFGVLFSGDGQPLWHGRRLRTVSPQQWRALLARDRGCVLCGAGPGYCHAHHIVAWTAPARGPTDIDNLVLVCNRHHRLIHQHGLVLARGPDGGWVAGTPDNRQTASRGRKPADRSPASRGRKPGGREAGRGRRIPEARSPVTIRAGP